MISRVNSYLASQSFRLLLHQSASYSAKRRKIDYSQPSHTRYHEIDNVLPPGYSVRNPSMRPLLFAIVPEGEKWVLEKFGKFEKILNPGIHFIIPFVQKVAFKHSMKEITFIIHKQQAITKDNVSLDMDGICYCRIYDPMLTSYEVERPFFAITNLAQTTMRSEIGRITLDQTFEERQNLNQAIVSSIEDAASHWGIMVERYEIRDIGVPANIKRAMELEAEAERQKRQEILLAEGQKKSKTLRSEGERIKKQNLADGEAYQIEKTANAKAEAIKMMAEGEAYSVERTAEAQAEAIVLVSEALEEENGDKAVQFRVAEDYIGAYSEIAKEGNTIIIPNDHNSVSSVVAQAMSIYEAVKAPNTSEQDIEDLVEQELSKTE